MTARKSIRRSSRYSIQSQMSGVLNPNSSNSEEEDNPLWFKDFEDNSATIRPSLRFGHVQDEPVLNSDSEPERTPLRKSWWKVVDDTPEARRSVANVTRERSSLFDKSLDASDLAVLNEGVAKPRSKMPRVKRKTSQGNLFTDILTSTSKTSSSGEDTGNSESYERDSSVSLTDSSMDRIKQPPPKKKKKMTISNLASESNLGDDAPDIFQDALEAPESGEDSRPGSTAGTAPNIESTGTTQYRQESFGKGGVPSDISEATTGADSDFEGRKSPLISQSKKRTMFTKIRTRKSAHFDDLLTNVPSEDEPSIGEEPAGNRSKPGVESRKSRPASRLASGSDFSIDEDDSVSDESIKKQNPKFPRKKRLTPEERIAAMFSDPDISIQSEPIAQGNNTEFVRPKDVSASDIVRRSSKQQKDRSRRSSSLNLESEERRAPKTPVRRSSGANKSVRQSGKKINNRTLIASPARVDEEMDQPETSIHQSHGAHESDSDERSISEEEEDIGSLSHADPIVEDSQPAKKAIPRSSTANKSVDDRRSRKEASDDEKRRSVNEEKDRSRVPEYSDDDDDGNEASHGANESDDEERTIMEEDDGTEEAQQTRKFHRRSNRIDESDVVEDSQSPRKSRGQSSRINEPDEVEESQPARKSRSGSSRMDESDVVEDSQPVRKSRGRSSRGNEPDEVEETQPTRKSRSRLSRVDESDKEGESGNEGIAFEKSSVSPDGAVGGNSSPIISVHRSGSANRSRDSTQDKSQSRISEKRLNIEDQSTPLRVEEKSTGQDSPVSDDEEEDDEILERSKNSSTSIRRSHMDPEDSSGPARPKRRETGPRNVEASTQPISADKSGDRRKSSAIVPQRPTSTHQPQKAVDKTSTAMEKENDEPQGGGEINGSRFLSTQTTRADPASVSFANSGGRGIVQQSKTSGGLFAGDKLTQLKAKLEEVKRQEAANLKYISVRKAILKNSKIDSYFKTISGNSSAAAKNAKKTPTDPKPVNKAYIMNGKVLEWKKPKLSRPKKWATDRLYKFLWNKMEPKYDIRTRVRSEKFVKNLSEVAAIIQRRTKYENYKAELNQLLREMAHLGIINTRNDFHLFCQEFLPYEFRIKVIPMILPGDVRNIPFHPEKLHTPILDSLD